MPKPMSRPTLYQHDREAGKYQVAYLGGQWIDVEPDLYWSLWGRPGVANV